MPAHLPAQKSNLGKAVPHCQVGWLVVKLKELHVGGQDAPTPIPWQVSLRKGRWGESNWPYGEEGHFCGGTILDATTILSAAHCFENGKRQGPGYYALAGTKTYYYSEQTIEIEKVILHDEYTGCCKYDFAIVKLKCPLIFNDKVQPACLPDASFAPDLTGQTCFISGWGSYKFGPPKYSRVLQWADVPLVTNDVCGATNDQICADGCAFISS